ncbi:hypothetical protein PAXRUDRAFT_833715 [Paxillus rubicundulus Ve08.2h10]|uniref:Uncharacterized protein n=1 Tax=Paxillus rubicundulus Ve08.2h10 TaxID=930991 RepID=A0A0D0CX19_9AGAM|nr:hypothetical protein PAXRUDRAFT_833715 [Paxillus rubicundulus Ve08.2h10]
MYWYDGIQSMVIIAQILTVLLTFSLSLDHISCNYSKFPGPLSLFLVRGTADFMRFDTPS